MEVQTQTKREPGRVTTHLAYRPDIDGLRAIAVLSVIAFHMQVGGMRGGYVGVDIFFVISGYLISSILLSDLRAGRFSLRTFYVRRIRRILPALVVAMLGTTILALLFLLPSELIDFAKSLIAAGLSASNLYFGFHSSYFDPRAFSRPAIQTWSLGVEEQFYLLFPPLLWLLHRRLPRWSGVVLGALAAASFAVSCYLVAHHTEHAFFMPWSRAWELLLGTFVAMPLLPPVRSATRRNLMAAAGLVLIIATIHFYGVALPFPGMAALVPCGGAMLLILSGISRKAPPEVEHPPLAPTLVSRLLAAPPLVFVGLISYSLYLWHWPIVVFVGMGALWGEGLPSKVSKAISLAVMLLLGTLSWRFVERPFREGRFRLSGAAAFRFAGISTTLLIAIGGAAILLKGLPQRFPARGVEVGSYLDETMDYRMGFCLVVRSNQFQPDVCLHHDPTRPNWLIVGDSHAGAQWPGLRDILPQVNLMQATHTACPPDPARTDGDCGAFMQRIFSGYLPSHPVDRIVAESRWLLTDMEAADHLVAWARAHHTPLTIIGPTQDYDVPLPRLLAFSIFHHDPTLAQRHRTPEAAVVDRAFAEAAATRWHVPYVSLYRMFCSPSGCETYANPQETVPLMLDEDHFTNEGSALAARRMVAKHLLP